MSKNFTYKEAYKPALYKWSFTNYSQSNIFNHKVFISTTVFPITVRMFTA